MRDGVSGLEDEIEDLSRELPRRVALEQLMRRPPAWYCPVHFYGMSAGIYITEDGLLARGQVLGSALLSQNQLLSASDALQAGMQIAYR